MIIEGAHTQARTQSRGQADADGYTLTVEDVAEQIGKSVETVRRYIRTGRLPAERIEGKNTNEYRINPDDLHAINAHTQSRTQSPARAGDRAHTLDSVTAPAEAVQALMKAVTTQLDAQYQARLDGKDELIEELRRRAEAAEREVGQLRRTQHGLPWWLRLLAGRAGSGGRRCAT